jgi:hypothetical protein
MLVALFSLSLVKYEASYFCMSCILSYSCQFHTMLCISHLQQLLSTLMVPSYVKVHAYANGCVYSLNQLFIFVISKVFTKLKRQFFA